MRGARVEEDEGAGVAAAAAAGGRVRRVKDKEWEIDQEKQEAR